MFHRSARMIVAGALALGFVSCAPTAQNTAQSLARERQQAERFVRDLDRKGKLIEDEALDAYVRGVVARISTARPPGSTPLRVHVVEDANVNAFTPGGGHVFFNAGLVAVMENEAQFATVAAHEIAHIDRGHVRAGMATRQGVRLGAALAAIAGAAAGVDPNVVELGVGLGANLSLNSFTRTQETDADNVGVGYLAAAGYNAIEGAKSFEVLRRLYGDQSGPAAVFFASHPASSDRQANLTVRARRLGATDGRIGNESHDRATDALRRDVLQYYEAEGRTREADQVRRASQ